MTIVLYQGGGTRRCRLEIYLAAKSILRKQCGLQALLCVGWPKPWQIRPFQLNEDGQVVNPPQTDRQNRQTDLRTTHSPVMSLVSFRWNSSNWGVVRRWSRMAVSVKETRFVPLAKMTSAAMSLCRYWYA